MADIQIKPTLLLSYALYLIQRACEIWLFFCFFHWAFLAFATLAGPDEMKGKYRLISSSFRFVFDNQFGTLMFISPLLIPIAFIALSIIRKKITVWEFLTIAAIWAIVIYVFPHLRS